MEAETWGHWIMHLLLHTARHLHDHHRVPFDAERLKRVAEAAIPLLNDHTPCLLHNDPHVWNVLVADLGSGWTCTGWLDWEYAWVGDPTWDLSRLDLWRIKPIGATPDGFWQGYGATPKEPNASVYRMSLCLWQVDEHLNHPDVEVSPTQMTALAYVEELDGHVAALDAAINASVHADR